MADRLQYSNKALVGNWYEDRLDSSSAPIPELERTGKYRITPLKMIETTPDLYITTNQAHHGHQVPLVPPPRMSFLSKNSLEAAHERIPAGSRTHGFGSTLTRHGPERDMRLLDTTTHSTHGGKYADSAEKRDLYAQQELAQEQKPAGGILREGRTAGGIRTGGATDERLQLGESDPKCHSFVQRSWVGSDSHQRHALNATSAAGAAARSSNTEGLALRGLGEQNQIARDDHNKKYYKKNDTLRRDTGIWNE